MICYRFAELCNNQGKLEEEEELYQYVLKDCEVWGLDGTLTLRTVNSLSGLYFQRGKLVDAEKMLQRALEDHEKALALDQTSTLDAINNLSLLYAE